MPENWELPEPEPAGSAPALPPRPPLPPPRPKIRAPPPAAAAAAPEAPQEGSEATLLGLVQRFVERSGKGEGVTGERPFGAERSC